MVRYNEFSFMWSDELFTFLGIAFSVNLNEIPELNYTRKMIFKN